MARPPEAPVPQDMTVLERLPGVVIQEKTQGIDAIMAAFGLPSEKENVYLVKAMPENQRLATYHGEPGTWSLSSVNALPGVYVVQEKSDDDLRAILACCGGLNLRPLNLHFYQGKERMYRVDRDCKMGGCCGCPLEMRLHAKDGTLQGAVVEEFDDCCFNCYEQFCMCIVRHKILVGTTPNNRLLHKYSLVYPMCCCGRVNNCFGSTCCKPHLFIDIEKPDGTLVAVAQKTYGTNTWDDCYRCWFRFSNYVLPFPPEATQQERVLLLTGILNMEYAYFSRQGGEN
ncbi:hypothetical protein Vafri_17866 [Volvox africanus]|uniref:Phospholipid scramblase n=1 Tax=Volvox africanus TaxID=51714 RepID=A0A8J4BRL2_9CHLO|nr:hypothetical protein Vafri_17866 [Volvox africanus]